MGSNASADNHQLDFDSVEQWSVDDVCKWVVQLGTEDSEISHHFNIRLITKYDINGQRLLSLNEHQLDRMGIKNESTKTCVLGHVYQLKSYVNDNSKRS